MCVFGEIHGKFIEICEYWYICLKAAMKPKLTVSI